jgi:hypothetical protein
MLVVVDRTPPRASRGSGLAKPSANHRTPAIELGFIEVAPNPADRSLAAGAQAGTSSSRALIVSRA